jgi:tRNA 2-thiocytidine biosynthesis protein TtcA
MLHRVRRLGIGLSGGADSLALLDALAELDLGVELVPVHVHQHADQQPDYLASYVHERLGLRTHVFHADTSVAAQAAIARGKAPCRACAPIRAERLGKAARALALDALALGHHLDDAAATLLMNIFHRGEVDTMRPVTRRRTHPQLPLVRPLLFVPEQAVKAAAPTGPAGLFDCGMCSVHAVERARATRFVAEMFGAHEPTPHYVAGLVAELAEGRAAGSRSARRSQ